MKRILPLLLLLAVCRLSAQTLDVNTGQVTYAYPEESVGNVTVSETSITVNGKEYNVSDITSIEVVSDVAENNTVSVTYDGNTASVVIAGNIADVVSAEVDGAHVRLVQGDATDEITYTLAGASSDGSLYMEGSLKATFVFAGLTLENPDSAAVNIQNGKRIAIELADGTTNTLKDGLSGDDDGSDGHKACLYVKGHTEISGTGSLIINGTVKHGITSHEYCLIKKSAGTITVTAENDGFHVDQYYEQRGGTVTVNSKGDGVDVSETGDDDDESNGEIILSGGTLTVTATGETSDAMKCDTDFSMTAGTVKLLATGLGGRALNVNGSASVEGGYIEGVTTGGIYAEDTDDDRKPHAMAVDENVTVSGGEVYFASQSNKSFKVDGVFRIDGGTLMGIGAKSVSASSDSNQPSNTYTKVKVTGGEAVTFDDVSFTVPSDFNISSGYVIVSREGLE